MKAVVYDGGLACREVPEPGQGGGVIISVCKAGICGTDVAIASGDYKVRTPLVPGHEIFGTAWRVPEDRAGLL